MEMEKDGKLPFLNVLVEKKSDGSLGHSVYRKPTYTNRYLSATSNHHPAHKRAVVKSLVDRAHAVSDSEHLKHELQYVNSVLLDNGYSKKQVQRAINPRRKTADSTYDGKTEESKNAVAVLPYIHNVTDRIGKILKYKGIKVSFRSTNTIRSCLRSAKNPLHALQTPGVYRIPCECDKVYVGMSQMSVKTRKKEHEDHLRLGHHNLSAVAEHSIKEKHKIKFSDIKVLAKEKYFNRLAIREAIEITQHPNNFNKDPGLKLGHTWNSVLKNRNNFEKYNDDIQVRFSEQMGSKVVWECFEKPVWYKNIETDHLISARFPVYRSPNIDEPRIIHIQARRLSDGAISSAWPFKFLPFISRFEIVDYCPKYRTDAERLIVDGHYWLLVVFSELINIYDIQVRFFEEVNGKVVWEEFADIDYNIANRTPKIYVMCPSYKSLEIDVPIETYIQCIRPSDGAKSTPVIFTFHPFKAKKPFPLKRICKRKIRHIIGKDQVEECINGLELPEELKIYLLQRTHNN